MKVREGETSVTERLFRVTGVWGTIDILVPVSEISPPSYDVRSRVGPSGRDGGGEGLSVRRWRTDRRGVSV